jgi:hypothetical protein
LALPRPIEDHPVPVRPPVSRRAFLALALLVAACGGGGGGSGGGGGVAVGEVVPDFALPDVNPASASFATDVSPRDFIGSASAWYFGHAT